MQIYAELNICRSTNVKAKQGIRRCQLGARIYGRDRFLDEDQRNLPSHELTIGREPDTTNVISWTLDGQGEMQIDAKLDIKGRYVIIER